MKGQEAVVRITPSRVARDVPNVEIVRVYSEAEVCAILCAAALEEASDATIGYAPRTTWAADITWRDGGDA